MTQETPTLSPEELDALLGQCNTKTPTGARNYALLQLMVQTGIRCGEALQVTEAMILQEAWGDNGNTVQVWCLRLPARATKGKKPRQGLPLTAATRAALATWQGFRDSLGLKGGPLFCTISEGTRKAKFATDGAELRPGKALDSRYVRDLVKRLAKKAGIARNVHPHMLRHTALTALYDRTQDLRLVQDVAGHSSSKTTERYTHVHQVAVARAMGAIDEGEA